MYCVYMYLTIKGLFTSFFSEITVHLMFFLARTVARCRVSIALPSIMTSVSVLRLVLELLALQFIVMKLCRAELGWAPPEVLTKWTIQIRVETSYAA